MQHSDVRTAPRRSHPRARTSALLLALAVACGGGSELTAPPALVNTGPENTGTPDVSGFYTRLEVDPAATCSPTTPPSGGTVILGTFSESQPIKLYQNGTRITLAYVNTPQLPADTGRVDLTGKIILGIQGMGMKENLRSGRQFYVDLTGSAQLTPSQGGTKYTGTGDYTYVFHEDSPTAPAYATCTRTVSFDFTKTS